jgi:NDP-sugar pyrophosphorylase family protein
MESNLNVIILAGGKGTRLRPLTFAVPKPLIPVGKKPILQILLERLCGFGLTRVHLAVGYRAELIETYFGNGKRLGLELFYHRERRSLGTAGPVRAMRDRFHLKGPCLVLNADIISDINFKHFIDWHKRKRSAMTVGCLRYEYRIPFGVLEIQKRHIRDVREKPSVVFQVSTGMYLVEQPAIDLVRPKTHFNMPDLMTKLIHKKMRLLAYPLTCSWKAIETLDDLQNFYHASSRGK